MPDKSKAGTYVTWWTINKLDGATSEDAFEMFSKVNKMAEQEWSSANEGVPQLKIAAAVTSACAMYAEVCGNESTVLREVAKTFQGLAGGRHAGISIPHVPSQDRPTLNDIWARVVYTILWDDNPSKRTTLDSEATRYFGKPIGQLRFFRSNIKTMAKADKGVAGMFEGARGQIRQDGRTRIKDYCS